MVWYQRIDGSSSSICINSDAKSTFNYSIKKESHSPSPMAYKFIRLGFPSFFESCKVFDLFLDVLVLYTYSYLSLMMSEIWNSLNELERFILRRRNMDIIIVKYLRNLTNFYMDYTFRLSLVIYPWTLIFQLPLFEINVGVPEKRKQSLTHYLDFISKSFSLRDDKYEGRGTRDRREAVSCRKDSSFKLQNKFRKLHVVSSCLTHQTYIRYKIHVSIRATRSRYNI